MGLEVIISNMRLENTRSLEGRNKSITSYTRLGIEKLEPLFRDKSHSDFAWVNSPNRSREVYQIPLWALLNGRGGSSCRSTVHRC